PGLGRLNGHSAVGWMQSRTGRVCLCFCFCCVWAVRAARRGERGAAARAPRRGVLAYLPVVPFGAAGASADGPVAAHAPCAVRLGGGRGDCGDQPWSVELPARAAERR